MEHVFVIKNFFRTDFVNLTVKSIRHFVPNAKIVCLNLYKRRANEYKNHSFFGINDLFYRRSKYDSKGLGGWGNDQNSLFFSEGYNYIYDYFKHIKKMKILILAEDHFFTNGQTIKEFIDQDFDIASGVWHHPAIPKGTDPINPPWMSRIPVPSWLHRDGSCDDSGWGPNASILGINLSKDTIKEIFPVPERVLDGGARSGGVELVLKQDIIKKAKELYIFSCRIGWGYYEDGIYSNDLEQIKKILIENKILGPEEFVTQNHKVPIYSEPEDLNVSLDMWPPKKTKSFRKG